MGVVSKSGDSDSIKPFATKSNDGKVESNKGKTEDNKGTGTGGGGSNKEPDDGKGSGLKKKIEVNGEYKSKIDFTDDIQSNSKPTTNTTFNSKDGSNVPSNVNSGEALKEKYKDLISAQKNAVKVEKLPDGRIRYYKESKPSKIPGNTKESCRVTEYNPQTGDVKSWQNNIGHDGKTIRVHVQRINGKEAIGQHYPQTGSEVSGVKQYPNYKDLKIQELIKKIDK
jgi:hypothetical protein